MPVPRGAATRKQAKKIEHDILCTLEELYSGCDKMFHVRGPTNGGNEPVTQKMDITIAPGYKSGTRITFRKYPLGPRISADVVFTVKEKPHAVFWRDGNDLGTKLSISLKDALLDTVLTVPTIANKDHYLIANEILRPGSKKRIPDAGRYNNFRLDVNCAWLF
jgi:DnaJ-class molecular chaperone